MARKNKLKKEPNKSHLNNILIPIVVFTVIAACGITIVTTEYDRAQKEIERAEITAKIENLQAENAELELTLNNDDKSAYLEKIAQEEFNYAYPDERRFYDTSRN